MNWNERELRMAEGGKPAPRRAAKVKRELTQDIDRFLREGGKIQRCASQYLPRKPPMHSGYWVDFRKGI